MEKSRVGEIFIQSEGKLMKNNFSARVCNMSNHLSKRHSEKSSQLTSDMFKLFGMRFEDEKLINESDGKD